MRIYPDDRVILKNVTFYVGKVPIFWWPYLYQSLDRTFSYLVAPAYLSSWGPSLLGQITFPIGDKITSTLKLDYRSRRGPALGFDSEIHYGKSDDNLAQVIHLLPAGSKSRFEPHCAPTSRDPNEPLSRLAQGSHSFYRRHRGDSGHDETERRVPAPGFFPESQFRYDPRPDSNIALTKTSPFYTLTALGRFQLNTFFETTERLPEVALDIKRHGLFGGPIFYEGETSVGELRPEFPGEFTLSKTIARFGSIRSTS